MKVCIYGAGAVGGYLAARIGNAGIAEVSVVARGVQKEAIAAAGVRLETPEGVIQVMPSRVTDDPFDLPPQDVTFVTLKVMQQPGAARSLCHLSSQGGVAVFVANGIPWWWKYDGQSPAFLPLIDPQGELWNRFGAHRAIGCVVYSANEVIAPGVIKHKGNNRWVLGEASGVLSDRLERIVQLMKAGGIAAEASPNLRAEILAKLLRNAAINSLCALTSLPVDGLAEDPELLIIADAIVDEIITVSAAMGYDISAHREAAWTQLRRGGAEGKAPAVKGLRPSMLQDVLAGRPIEVEAILGQFKALAEEHRASCPAIDGVLPLVRGLDRSLRAKL